MEEYVTGKSNPNKEVDFDPVESGYYQVAVVNAEIDDQESNLIVDLEIIAGTKESEIGKTHREWFSLNAKEGNRKKRLKLATVCDQCTPEQIDSAEKNGWALKIDYLAITRKHFVCELQKKQKMGQNEYGEYKIPTGDYRTQIPYSNMWHIDSDACHKKGVKVDRSKIDADPFGSPPEEEAPKSDF